MLGIHISKSILRRETRTVLLLFSQGGLAAEVVQPNFVGRYGETVYFHNLPESMQTPTMASFLGESKQDLTFSESGRMADDGR